MLKKVNLDIIKEELYTGTINGLRVYIAPRKGFSKSYAMLTTKYGSNDIEFAKGNGELKEYPKGIAHFLEHKLFEEKEGNIFNRFSELGASPNAFTNFQITAYYFSCTQGFDENLKLLINFVYNPYFTEENVEKEKGIIEQEIRMYDDNPNTKVYYNAMESMYINHPVQYDIAGTVESIYKITPELLYECYNTFYVPENMILTIVGDINVEKAEEIIKNNVPTDRAKADFTFREYNEPESIEKSDITKKMGLSIPNFIIGYKDTGKVGKGKWLQRKISMDIICRLFFTRSSSLYERLYNEGYINESFSFEYTLEKDYAHLIVGGESKNPKKVLSSIVEYIKDNAENNIKTEDFERVKKMLAGSFISRFNSIEGLGHFMNDYFIRELDPFMYYDVLKSIQLDDIMKRLQEINDESKWVLSVVD